MELTFGRLLAGTWAIIVLRIIFDLYRVCHQRCMSLCDWHSQTDLVPRCAFDLFAFANMCTTIQTVLCSLQNLPLHGAAHL